jgi:formate hydrogenlyase transcriptional activator
LPTAEHERRSAISSGATTLRDSERTLIQQTLETVGWIIGGQKGAAAKLGLKRTTLIHKMQKLGIARPALRSSENIIGPRPQGPGSFARHLSSN